MTYPVSIVMNSRNWYDSRIIETNPVVYQNVNYNTGNDRSVNRVRHRFMQDWARRIIPNSIRQGVGLGDPAGSSDQISITEGYAVVAGRFINIPAGTFDASVEGLTGSGGTPVDYYLVIRVHDGSPTQDPFVEGDNRDPTAEGSHLVAVAVLGYTNSHNELVIAKFRYNGSVIDNFEDYTAEQEWQANTISPVAARPGLSTGSNTIIFRGGDIERVNNLGIEPDKTRFYLNAVFNDQVSSTEVKLINNSGILKTRNLGDSAYLGQDMLNLLIGGTTVIDNSRNLINLGTINGGTIGGNSLSNDFVTRGAVQTLTNKTLTSPIINGGIFNGGVALTVDSTELNQLDSVSVGGNTAGDIITTDDIQTLTNKTLTSPSLTTPIISDFTNATHAHSAASSGGIIPISNTSGTLSVIRGGTGQSSLWTDGGVLFASSTTTTASLRSSNDYSFLLQGSTGDPTWVEPSITLTGDVTGSDSNVDSNGNWSIATTVGDNSHNHTMTNVGIQKHTHFVDANNTDSGSGVSIVGNGVYYLDVQFNSIGDEFHIYLPYFTGKTISEVSIRADNVGTNIGIHLQPVFRWLTTTGSGSSDPLGTLSQAYIVSGGDYTWTGSDSTNDIYKFLTLRITRSSDGGGGARTLRISTVTVTYSN